MILSKPQVGPYMGVDQDQEVGKYRIILYGAYNAMGLIGSEHNGIAVLDNENHTVVLDRHCQINSGYYGPSPEQHKEYERVVGLPYDELVEWIASHPRNRYR